MKTALEEVFDRIQADPKKQLEPSQWLRDGQLSVYVRYYKRIGSPRERVAPYWVLELGNFGPKFAKTIPERRLPAGFFTGDPFWGKRLCDLLEQFEEFAQSIHVPFNVTQITFGYGVEEILAQRGYLPFIDDKTSFRFHGDLKPERIDGADVYTIEEFRGMCKKGIFNEYDGSGVYGTETLVSPRYRVWEEYSEEAEEAGLTHVHWYNK